MRNHGQGRRRAGCFAVELLEDRIAPIVQQVNLVYVIPANRTPQAHAVDTLQSSLHAGSTHRTSSHYVVQFGDPAPVGVGEGRRAAVLLRNGGFHVIGRELVAGG
jgi:hypothetical protein